MAWIELAESRSAAITVTATSLGRRVPAVQCSAETRGDGRGLDDVQKPPLFRAITSIVAFLPESKTRLSDGHGRDRISPHLDSFDPLAQHAAWLGGFGAVSKSLQASVGTLASVARHSASALGGSSLRQARPGFGRQWGSLGPVSSTRKNWTAVGGHHRPLQSRQKDSVAG